ncbi:MAG: diguanylate cyclase [Chloroflexi bacterium]|nr:diguanylate cyclase [Chloroflexota bacterium]
MNETDGNSIPAPRILLVDDDELHRHLLTECLISRGGCTVDTASNAHAAMERLRATAFDAVVLDYALPDASGLDVLRTIREQGWDVPVVMVTGSRSTDVAVAAMKAGAADYVVKDFVMFARLPQTIAEVIDAHRQRQVQQRRLAELEHLANEDFLTGLTNRRAFEERFRQEWERAHRYGRPLALALLDLDDFKRVNDTHGHRIGDRVLAAVGRALRSTFRIADVTARYGGDEFVVLMPETDEASARIAISRLMAALEALNARGDLPVAVSISVGLAVHSHERDPEALLEAADRALYADKQIRHQHPSRA